MSVEIFAIGPLSTNSYLINNGASAAAIDVGGDPAPMLTWLKANNLKLEAICLTHMHFDHLYGVSDLASATGAPVYAPKGDAPLLNTESARGGMWGMPPVKPFNAEPLPLGKTVIAGMECNVLSTPGHTPGGVSLYFPDQNCVFTGDALFYRSLGRTDFPYGSHETLLASIQNQLFTLPEDVIVYPGHGPATTIGEERVHNPFCGQDVM